MSEEMEAMIAEAKERLHRSIGQRARWAQAAIAAQAAALRRARGASGIATGPYIDYHITIFGAGGSGGSGKRQ